MNGYRFFKGGTTLMALASFAFVILIVFGIVSSTFGGWPVILHLGSTTISSATPDGAVALTLIAAWIGLLGAGILTRDLHIFRTTK